MRSVKLRSVVAFAALLFSCAIGIARQSSDEPKLKNSDFVGDTIGKAPADWTVTPAELPVAVVEDSASTTKRSVQVGPPPSDGKTVGDMVQQIDAAPYRGKRIIVRADVRLAYLETTTQLRNAKAQMWVRVDRESGKPGFFNNMNDRPIRGLRAFHFQTYEITGVVDADAKTLNIGLLVFDGTVAHVGKFTVAIAEPDEHADAPAAPLTPRGLENLVAFAKLSGYIRHFHPSDEAAGIEWERFIAAAAERIEKAADAQALATVLKEVFAPIAPTVQVWAGGVAAAPPEAAKPEGADSYKAWRHCGVNATGQVSARAMYTSKRLESRVESPSADLPKPGATVVKDLGGGVCCRVPLTAYVDAAGATIPHATGEVVTLQRPDWWALNGNDRSARLAGVIVAWNIFQHFYSYFDVVDADWPRVLRESLASAASAAGEVEYLKTLQWLVGELDDGHGVVTPINFSRPHPFDAIFDWAGDKLVVAKVGEDVADVERGDEVIAIAGVPTREWYKECRGRISAATEQWARWRACSDHSFFGWTNEPIEMAFSRDGKTFKASLPRIAGDQTAKETRSAGASEVAPGIVYFNLDSAEAPAWKAALPVLAAAKGVILDMRGYPGSAGMLMLTHLTDTPIQSAKWIVPWSTMPDHEGVEWEHAGRWNLGPAKPRLGADGQKVVVITDGRAISYAESCMGIVEAYKLADIVGGATAGSNGNINPFTVCGGYHISWTGMKVLKHDDSPHHGVAIAATVPKSRTIEGIKAGRDELLEAAIETAQKVQ